MKPLHVLVAEAIGARKPVDLSLFPAGCYDTYGDVPCFDTDWAATGPLIERYRICLFRGQEGMEPKSEAGLWAAGVNGQYGARHGWYQTPLLAVCNLLLALPKAGGQ